MEKNFGTLSYIYIKTESWVLLAKNFSAHICVVVGFFYSVTIFARFSFFFSLMFMELIMCHTQL